SCQSHDRGHIHHPLDTGSGCRPQNVQSSTGYDVEHHGRVNQIPFRDTGKVNDRLAPLRSRQQRGRVQEIADHQLATKTRDALDSRATPHKPTDFQTAGAKHAHNHGPDEAITASYQNFHEATNRPHHISRVLHLRLVHFTRHMAKKLTDCYSHFTDSSCRL